MGKYSGADWLENNTGTGHTLSPIGRKVADILGFVFRGIYHMDWRDLNASDWGNPLFAYVRLSRGLATFDFQHLSEMLVLCFDHMVRLEIRPRSNQTLELLFHQRESREGGVIRRLPELFDLVQEIRVHAHETRHGNGGGDAEN